MIRMWWQSRLGRERLFIGISGVIAVIIFVYVFIFSPLSSRVSAWRREVQSQQELFIWMKQAEARILSLRQAGYSQVAVTKEPLLALVERSLTDQKLNAYLERAQQSNPNEINLNFHQVPFDEFMTWIQQLSRKYRIVVQSIKITKGDLEGTADITLVAVSPNAQN